MISLKNIILVTRNARDKIQIANSVLSQDANTFYINRYTGQHMGKVTEQPLITIVKGKAKRSPIEQAELEFNSIIKKYQDKGYKILSDLTKKDFESLSESELLELVPSIKSDSDGFLKPMLAKDASKMSTNSLNKKHLCSKKLDGVRAMPQLRDGEIRVISRGGKEYFEPTKLIKEELKQLFEEFPDIILDGEIYRHGKHLQEISGLIRRHEWNDKCKSLQYWIYDVIDVEKTFEERLELLNTIKEYFKDSSIIKVLDHVETNSYLDMKNLHDKWVDEGYEGLIGRKPLAKYMPGKRGSELIKLKVYQEDEFEIIDYKDGLRDEDFCFICQTKEGKPFAAKPIGDRELKDQYLNDIDNIIGKVGTVKFFEYSKDNVPMQPIFQTIRDYE